MAGFQQAANALTGSVGTVGARIGVYNELVGKNKEQREQLAKQNEELTKKNEELTKKNELINIQKESLSIGDELLERYMSDRRNMYIRNMEHTRARASRDIMLDVVYGEKPTAGPTRNFAKEELKREREKLNGGGK